jgi:hypothetical protein
MSSIASAAWIHEDKWLSRARDGLAARLQAGGAVDRPAARETRHASLREVFQSELQLGTNIVRHPEFAEGVRALLIDKDRNPAWAYARSRDVPGGAGRLFHRTVAGESARRPVNGGRDTGEQHGEAWALSDWATWAAPWPATC